MDSIGYKTNIYRPLNQEYKDKISNQILDIQEPLIDEEIVNKFNYITTTDLKTVINSMKDYDTLYLEITMKAANYYREAQRYRSVVRLNGEVAELY